MSDIKALRDIAANHGWPICDEAADEIEDLEKAYGLLFKENAALRAQQAVLAEALTRIGDPEFRYSSDDDEDTQLSLRMADARAALVQGEG